MSQVKPAKDISKNPSKSLPKKFPMEKEVLPSHKLQNHAYE